MRVTLVSSAQSGDHMAKNIVIRESSRPARAGSQPDETVVGLISQRSYRFSKTRGGRTKLGRQQLTDQVVPFYVVLSADGVRIPRTDIHGDDRNAGAPPHVCAAPGIGLSNTVSDLEEPARDTECISTPQKEPWLQSLCEYFLGEAIFRNLSGTRNGTPQPTESWCPACQPATSHGSLKLRKQNKPAFP
jgi:hypothetical protein